MIKSKTLQEQLQQTGATPPPERITEGDRAQVEWGRKNPIRRRPSFEGVEVYHIQKPSSIDDYSADRIREKLRVVEKLKKS